MINDIQKEKIKELDIKIPVLNKDGSIPEKYTCDGENINPPIEIRKIPAETISLTLIVDDPDAPIHTWLHWMVWNIPVTKYIAENKIEGIEGINDFQMRKYSGPCPPSGTHRYFFKVYALDTLLKLPYNIQKYQLMNLIKKHTLAYGEVVGLYSKQ